MFNKSNKKYKLTNEYVMFSGVKLYRIKALKSFNSISKGDLGGYIEKESNLSQDDNAWVYDNASVSGNAKVHGNARVYENARIYDNAKVFGIAWVCGNARVFGDARVFGNASVFGNACVYEDAWAYDNAKIYDNAMILGQASVFGYATLKGFDEISNKNQIMSITGFQYQITVTYCSIHIGCKSYTIDQLDTVFDDDAYKNKNNIPLIKSMIEISLEKILEDIA